jgi:EAL domain-containing protein (putative c-di-GMP-specific phosphodiesterase class I)
MFEKVVQVFQSPQKHDPSSTASLNISANSCADPDFVERILTCAGSYQVDVENIVFEISESAAVKNAPDFLENLVRLRLNGFGVSIDEYGTAYSGVQQLYASLFPS